MTEDTMRAMMAEWIGRDRLGVLDAHVRLADLTAGSTRSTAGEWAAALREFRALGAEHGPAVLTLRAEWEALPGRMADAARDLRRLADEIGAEAMRLQARVDQAREQMRELTD